MTAYSAMTEYKECEKFMDELKKLNDLVADNAETKDDTVILSLSRDDFLRIRVAFTQSNNITCSYKDTIGKMMVHTEMPDTLV